MPRQTPSLNRAATDTPLLNTATVEALRLSSFESMSDPAIAKLTGRESNSLASLLHEILHTHWTTIANRPAVRESTQEKPTEKVRASMNRVSRTALDLSVELSKLPTGFAPMPNPAWRLSALIPNRSDNATNLADLIDQLINDDQIASIFTHEPDGIGLRASANSDKPRAIKRVVNRARSLAVRLAELTDEADALDVQDVQKLERVVAQFVADADATLAALGESGDVMRRGHQPDAMRREILITELYALRLMLTGRRDRYSKADGLGGPFGILTATMVATVENKELDSFRSNSLGDRITAAANAVEAVTPDFRLPDPFAWWSTYHSVKQKALGRLRYDENVPVSDKRVDSTS